MNALSSAIRRCETRRRCPPTSCKWRSQLKEKVEKRDLASTGPNQFRCEQMEYVYASITPAFGRRKVTEAGVTKVLTAAGVKVEEPRIKALVAALSEIKIEDALKGCAGYTSSRRTSQLPRKGKKEEKKPEDDKKKGEEALAGLGALFG